MFSLCSPTVHCFSFRLWDLYLLEGDCILIAMAYNILRMHQKTLLKMDMDGLMEFLQNTLPKSFGFDDETVIDRLKDCLAELRSSKLHRAGATPDTEKPQKPFGMFQIPVEEEEEEEEMLGTRVKVGEEERRYLASTLQRQEDNIAQLRHIDSTSSVEDGSLELGPGAGEGSDSSVGSGPGPQLTRQLQDSLTKLDRSLDLLLAQADLPVLPGSRSRPASAGPARVSTPRQPRRGGRGRAGRGTQQQRHRSSRSSAEENSSDSREINLSSDSAGADCTSRPASQGSHHRYYYGQTPPPVRSQPKPNYYFGETPDMDALLDRLEAERGEDPVTPTNRASSPAPRPGRLPVAEHNLRILQAGSPQPGRAATGRGLRRPDRSGNKFGGAGRGGVTHTSTHSMYVAEYSSSRYHRTTVQLSGRSSSRPPGPPSSQDR